MYTSLQKFRSFKAVLNDPSEFLQQHQLPRRMNSTQTGCIAHSKDETAQQGA